MGMPLRVVPLSGATRNTSTCARAHEAQAPVVEELARVRLLVGVTGDLEVARAERRVAVDDVGDLLEDLLALRLERVLARVEEDVARQLDDHPVVADDDLEADARELVETRLEVAEAAFMSSSCLRRASYSDIACRSFDFSSSDLERPTPRSFSFALRSSICCWACRVLLLVVGVALVGRVEIGLELGDVALRLLPLVFAVTAPGERERAKNATSTSRSDLQLCIGDLVVLAAIDASTDLGRVKESDATLAALPRGGQGADADRPPRAARRPARVNFSV